MFPKHRKYISVIVCSISSEGTGGAKDAYEALQIYRYRCVFPSVLKGLEVPECFPSISYIA
jgi:hypothetical protein